VSKRPAPILHPCPYCAAGRCDLSTPCGSCETFLDNPDTPLPATIACRAVREEFHASQEASDNFLRAALALLPK
jgi:hypothetical protein